MPEITSQKLVEHLISNGVTLLVAFLLITQTATEVEPEYVRVLQEDLITLRSEYNQQTAKLVTATILIAELERLAGGESIDDVEGGAIYSFLDRIKRPAWCKSVVYNGEGEDPSFVMEYLNRDYEERFKFTLSYYKGKTDFEAHRPDLAQRYYQNDLQAWATKDYLEFLEPTIRDGTLGWFAKWWFPLPSGREFVCGMEVARQLPDGSYSPVLQD